MIQNDVFFTRRPSNRPPETINLTIPIIPKVFPSAIICLQSIPGLKSNGASPQSEIFLMGKICKRPGKNELRTKPRRHFQWPSILFMWLKKVVFHEISWFSRFPSSESCTDRWEPPRQHGWNCFILHEKIYFFKEKIFSKFLSCIYIVLFLFKDEKPGGFLDRTSLRDY